MTASASELVLPLRGGVIVMHVLPLPELFSCVPTMRPLVMHALPPRRVEWRMTNNKSTISAIYIPQPCIKTQLPFLAPAAPVFDNSRLGRPGNYDSGASNIRICVSHSPQLLISGHKLCSLCIGLCRRTCAFPVSSWLFISTSSGPPILIPSVTKTLQL
jgi:hypothetical protein